jgi:RHS repeat-associated protein
LGSVIAEVDNTGTITATNQTDVYGNTLSSSGTSTTDHKFVGKFGHRTEASTGNLTYMGARYYDPALGRFISEDPSGNGANWYAYCSNSPVNLVDPDGKHSDFITTHSTFWYSVGVACTFMALLQAAAYPKIGKWKIVVSVSISRFANSAITAFGLAQLGRDDISIATQLATGYGAAISWMVSEAINASSSGLRTIAGVAVAAAVLYSVMLAGTIVGDYAEQVTRL